MRAVFAQRGGEGATHVSSVPVEDSKRLLRPLHYHQGTVILRFALAAELLYGSKGFTKRILAVQVLLHPREAELFALGVIGEYVGRIFEEAKRRPLYVLRRVSRAA